MWEEGAGRGEWLGEGREWWEMLGGIDQASRADVEAMGRSGYRVKSVCAGATEGAGCRAARAGAG